MKIDYTIVGEDVQINLGKNVLEHGVSVQELLQKDWLFSICFMPNQYDVSIKRVSVIEVKDFSAWLLGNELALTTIQNFPTIKLQKSLIHRLSMDGAACLALHPGQNMRENQEIFKETIEYARKLNFPILLLNHNTTYSEVIDEVFKIELETQSQHIGSYNQINQELFQYLSNNSGIDCLIQKIGKETKREVLLADIDLTPLTYSNPLETSQLTEILANQAFKRFINEPDINKLIINGYILHVSVNLNETDTFNILLAPINKGDYLKSMLFVIGEPNSLLIDKVLKDTVFALQMEKENTTELDFELMDLANRELLIENNFKQAREKFIKLGITLDDKSDLFVMDVDIDQEKRNTEDISYVKNLKSRIKRHVDRYLIDGNFSVWFENKLVFYIGEKTKGQVLNIATQVEDIMKQYLPFLRFYIGVSSLGSTKFYYLYREAMHAIYSGKINGKNLTTYNELGLLQLFTGLENNYYLEKYYRSVLQPLLKVDKERQNELLGTLSTFIDHNLNYKDTAHVLFVHPNTVRYRIKQIDEIYGEENVLFEAEKRFSIQLALKLMNVM